MENRIFQEERSGFLLKRMKKKRVGVRLFKAFVLCILLLGIVGVAAGGVFVKHVIDNTPEVTAKDILLRGIRHPL